MVARRDSAAVVVAERHAAVVGRVQPEVARRRAREQPNTPNVPTHQGHLSRLAPRRGPDNGRMTTLGGAYLPGKLRNPYGERRTVYHLSTGAGHRIESAHKGRDTPANITQERDGPAEQRVDS